MVSSKSENNTIRVSVKNTTNVTKANASSINSSNPVNASNNQAKIYEQQALAHANTSKYWAEQSETSALKSENYAKQSELSANSLLQNENFISVSENLEVINTVGESIKNVNYVGENIESINQLVEDLNNLGDTTNIEIVATNIDSVNTTAENIETVKAVSSSTSNMTTIINNLTSINYVADNIEDIVTVEENKNIVLSKVEEAIQYSESANNSSTIASSQAIISTEQATLSKSYSDSAKTSETNAQTSSNNANSYMQQAKTYFETAREQANISLENAEISTTQASNSLESSKQAKTSETNALTYSNSALASSTSASNSEAQAKIYSQEAKAFRDEAEEIVANAGGGASGSTQWGGISGTLSNQTDLQAVLDSKANTSDIPDVSNFATKSELSNKINAQSPDIYTPDITNPTLRGDDSSKEFHYPRRIEVGTNYIDIVSFGLAEEEGTELRVDGEPIALKSDIPDASNLATKSDVANKQDKFSTSLPLTMGGLKTSTTNISYDNNGKAYLNDVAYYATLPELLPTAPLIGTNTDIKPSFSADSPQTANPTLRFSKIKGTNGDNPILNLDGYNAIIHEFKVGDIIMGDQPCEYANYNDLEMCFGKIADDGTFTPRCYARTYGWGASARWSFISELISPSGVSISKQQQRYSSNYLMTYGVVNTNFITLSNKTHANISNMADIYGIKLVERNGGMSFNWVTLDGTEIELSDCGSMDFSGINCVVYKGIVYDVSTATNVANKGFDPNRYFVANGTIDNVIVRMLDGTGVDSLAIKYSDDFKLNENNEISLNAEKIPTMPIGTIIPINASADYVPDGLLPCDGAEYTKEQFNDLWKNYLINETYTLNSELTVSLDATIENEMLTGGCSVKTSSLDDEVIFCFQIGKDVITKQNIGVATGCYIQNGNFYSYQGTFLSAITANSRLYIKTTYEYNTGINGTSTTPYRRNEQYSLDNITYSEIYDYTSSSLKLNVSVRGDLPVVLSDSYYNNVPLLINPSYLNTCTYSEYEADLTTYGQCSKFAVDVENYKFRVPLIKDTETVVTNNIDYDNYLTIDTLPLEASPFVAPYDGVMMYTLHQNKNATITCYINGVARYIYLDGDATNVPETYYTPLSKGDTLYWSSSVTLKYGGFHTYKKETKEKLKSFVVVANGQTNQSLMDWSAWASSLQGKANIDLSNLSDKGKKVIDGQWVSSNLVLFNSSTTAGERVFDLSEYLPNDEYNYEIFGIANICKSGETHWTLYNDIIQKGTINIETNTNAVLTSSYFNFPISTQRKLCFSSSASMGTAQSYRGIELLAYRRLGKNE